MMARGSTMLRAAALALMSALAACHSAPTRIYTLTAVAPSASAGTAPSSTAAPRIRVDAVHVPPPLDRAEVVSNVAPGELKINDLDHWSAPLGQIARQALSADLVERLPRDLVIFPHLAKSEGALGITVDLLDFRAEGENAVLQASWIITASAAPPAGSQAARGGTAELRVARRGTGAAATAQALSALLGQLADRIAAGL